ncbi:alpha,alpha-trehalase nth1 [Rhizophlyctis rosea]|nr:alpha,alpha-trehalase nth1 [Rhizophlyctis rosea]
MHVFLCCCLHQTAEHISVVKGRDPITFALKKRARKLQEESDEDEDIEGLDDDEEEAEDDEDLDDDGRPIAERIDHIITRSLWKHLSRSLDLKGLKRMINTGAGAARERTRIYIPFRDELAWEYYTEIARTRTQLNLDVIRLPEIMTPQYVKSLDYHPGILSLGLRKTKDEKTGKEVVRGTPFVVPGGQFNEMYGWDSYFEALGLLADNRVDLARAMVENFVYEIEFYGKILNANRSYCLTRSQPPFLTDMIKQVAKRLPDMGLSQPALKKWKCAGYRASVKEIFSVWMASPRLDRVVGLCKFYTEGVGMPPEMESSHFTHILEPYAHKMGISVEDYMEGYVNETIKEPELDQYFVHYRAALESGHSDTYRFEHGCANLATIDLNSLVYKYDVDLADVFKEEFNGCFKFRVRRGPSDIFLNGFKQWYSLIASNGVGESIGNNGGWDSDWAKGIMCYDEAIDEEYARWVDGREPVMPTDDLLHSRENDYLPIYDAPEGKEYFTVYMFPQLFTKMAERQRELIDKYLWNKDENLFYDFDCALNEPSTYHTVTCLWALWAGHASQQQADKMVPRVMELFEVVGGLLCGTEESRGHITPDRPDRQWDYPYGWAPHQILGWSGLQNYGFRDDARRLAYRWLYTIVKSFVDFNGAVPHKFDVVGMVHQIEATVGNFAEALNESMSGVVAASFKVGISYMTPELKHALDHEIPACRLSWKGNSKFTEEPLPLIDHDANQRDLTPNNAFKVNRPGLRKWLMLETRGQININSKASRGQLVDRVIGMQREKERVWVDVVDRRKLRSEARFQEESVLQNGSSNALKYWINKANEAERRASNLPHTNRVTRHAEVQTDKVAVEPAVENEEVAALKERLKKMQVDLDMWKAKASEKEKPDMVDGKYDIKSDDRFDARFEEKRVLLDSKDGKYVKVFRDKVLNVKVVCKYFITAELPFFHHECRINALVEHKHVVTYLGALNTATKFGLFMEHMDGTLEDLVRTLSLHKFRSIVAQCCRGLAYLHRRGIYHCDLKTANILFRVEDKRLVVKLADLGHAVQAGGKGFTDAAVGTYGYFPPEVLERMGGELVGSRQELWEQLEETKTGVTFRKMDRPNIPDEVQDFVKSMLKLNVKERPTIEMLNKHLFVLAAYPAIIFPKNQPTLPGGFHFVDDRMQLFVWDDHEKEIPRASIPLQAVCRQGRQIYNHEEAIIYCHGDDELMARILNQIDDRKAALLMSGPSGVGGGDGGAAGRREVGGEEGGGT